MSFEAAATMRRVSPGSDPVEGRVESGGASSLHFVAEVTEQWGQGRAAFGGLVAAFGARGIAAAVPSERRLRSVLVDFLAPVGLGAVTVDVTPLRAGKAITHVEARVSQGGAVCAVLVGACAQDRVTAVHAPGAPPPDVPPPDAVPAFPYIEGITPVFTQQFDYRWTGAGLPFTGSRDTRVAGWVRPAERAADVDAALILAMVDAWPAPVLALVTGHAPASTVTWKADLPAAPRASEWWRFEAELVASEGGYASITGQLWDDAGGLVAVSSQLVAEFSR